MAEAIENAETQETGEKPVFSDDQQIFINKTLGERISKVNANNAKNLEHAEMDKTDSERSLNNFDNRMQTYMEVYNKKHIGEVSKT